MIFLALMHNLKYNTPSQHPTICKMYIKFMISYVIFTYRIQLTAFLSLYIFTLRAIYRHIYLNPLRGESYLSN